MNVNKQGQNTCERDMGLPLRGILPSPPHVWQNAFLKVAQRNILPPELRGSGRHTYNAWRGDKFLGAAAAKVLHYSGRTHTEGTATKLTAIALSNSFMAKHHGTLLPGLSSHIGNLSEHGIGTILEAAVAEIFEANQPAVDDLARWLLHKAETSPDPNAKGQLLQHGGTVTVHNIREGSDHSPIYTATANLNGISAEGKGSTKKKAEQLASETVLGLSFF
jgi:dsRNA-specific ribonuclease